MKNFKRFTDLTITGIPESSRLVVLTGPNGSGKSAIFEAFNVERRRQDFGIHDDPIYYNKAGLAELTLYDQVNVEYYDESVKQDSTRRKKALWIRSAFRHQADVHVTAISPMDSHLNSPGLLRLTDIEGLVSENYSRIASNTLDVFYAPENRNVPAGDLVDGLIAPLQDSMRRVFDGLVLDSLTAPMDQASFFFTKGSSKGFHYKNLSAGERAGFDLLLDMYVRTRTFDDTVYCIDEPELHLGSRVQARLLEELVAFTPPAGQLWIATHSPGMMRAAIKLHQDDPDSITFIDTFGHNFDEPGVLRPVRPTNAFWRRSLEVALDDIASLVAPEILFLCEGSPVDGFDAVCYRKIFAEKTGIEFVSVGSSIEVKRDSQGIGAAIQVVAPGTKVVRIIDRDDHSDHEIGVLRTQGVRVLSVRNIECHLLADDVLSALCHEHSRPEIIDEILAERRRQLEASAKRGNPPDDFKKISGSMKDYLRRELRLTQSGSTTSAFLSEFLAPLIKPGMATYEAFDRDLFGQ